MVWANLLSKGGAMSNPFEYREILQASFAYDEDRTVEQVLAEHKARHDEGTKRDPKKPPEPGRAPTKSELDKLREMMGLGSPLATPAQE